MLSELFFEAALPSPTFGTGGLFWASLTLALLTLPVVIVSTEEGLARIPRTIREGSLALGATRWETLWRTVLPMASPAIMTGMILAVARAAGEVAPLMLVGVVKLAPSLPLDGNYPFLHPERKFMHLGFHIYDLGFQSQNSEAAKPMDVTVFSRDGCPYCVRAKGMLHDAGIQFEELVLNRDYTEATIRAVSGESTVPQVFINGERIGGSEAVEAYLRPSRAA